MQLWVVAIAGSMVAWMLILLFSEPTIFGFTLPAIDRQRSLNRACSFHDAESVPDTELLILKPKIDVKTQQPGNFQRVKTATEVAGGDALSDSEENSRAYCHACNPTVLRNKYLNVHSVAGIDCKTVERLNDVTLFVSNIEANRTLDDPPLFLFLLEVQVPEPSFGATEHTKSGSLATETGPQARAQPVTNGLHANGPSHICNTLRLTQAARLFLVMQQIQATSDGYLA
ncbi:hypothetical protein BO83DRAFT_386650 [Aspergillus eucalypticola CBS 122712]|uniref:Uncharacterized protein n=1 Tax=Aspergillus eucalypticola (strain CBS 122712 / IBT 29274) TaxID=1448314 RepID=A0A317W164_ASPEC|nr:uncharacterized protein BO83DRAFT_386650 [Aspergillus eucalypticola CBS 122712]PWY78967.1 hypothetical protein BO83DRAFT_386650 [Aspergillus eucalypticola CBS 122712]